MFWKHRLHDFIWDLYARGQIKSRLIDPNLEAKGLAYINNMNSGSMNYVLGGVPPNNFHTIEGWGLSHGNYFPLKFKTIFKLIKIYK